MTDSTLLPAHLALALEALVTSLQSRPQALALLALGSIGAEPERADAWSDLDFFVIVQRGAKRSYLDSLDWLADAKPLAWAFANTVDGYKAITNDGLLCEFAVFEPQELAGIPYSPGRWAWRRDDSVPQMWASSMQPLPSARSVDWLVGEALSNLLVGLQRFRRGERLAAMRMVQVYALDRLLELIDSVEVAQAGVRRDAFNVERRFEFRHPSRAALLAECAAGVDATPACAGAILHALQSLADVPPFMQGQIERLTADCQQMIGTNLQAKLREFCPQLRQRGAGRGFTNQP